MLWRATRRWMDLLLYFLHGKSVSGLSYLFMIPTDLLWISLLTAIHYGNGILRMLPNENSIPTVEKKTYHLVFELMVRSF